MYIPQWGLLMGMEHERIHLETSSVLIRQLPVDLVTKPEGWVYGPVKAGRHRSSSPLCQLWGSRSWCFRGENLRDCICFLILKNALFEKGKEHFIPIKSTFDKAGWCIFTELSALQVYPVPLKVSLCQDCDTWRMHLRTCALAEDWSDFAFAQSAHRLCWIL